MKIDSILPDYVSFIKSEISTIKFLSTDSDIASNFSDLQYQAHQFNEIYGTIDEEKIKKNRFSFGFHFEIEIQKKKKTILLEGLIEPAFTDFSYQLSICKSADKSYRLLRNFHFDYTPVKVGQLPKPMYHLQYGGKATPKMNELNVKRKGVHEWLSQPRMNIPPMTIALLVDLVLNEFPNQHTVKFKEKNYWRSIVKQNEVDYLKPYYENIVKFMESRNYKKSNKLLREFFYGD